MFKTEYKDTVISVRFHHTDKGNGYRRRRVTNCTISQVVGDEPYNIVLLGHGTAKYKETDVKLGLPYIKAFARQLSLYRAMKSIGDKEFFGQDFWELVWTLYFSKVSENEEPMTDIIVYYEEEAMTLLDKIRSFIKKLWRR